MPANRIKFLFLLAVSASPCIALASPMVDATLSNWELDRLDSVLSTAATTPSMATGGEAAPGRIAAAAPATSHPATAASEPKAGGLRHLLADFAMTLRDIRYRRGGKAPETGFDCSGFVRYVFRNAVGKDLPANSASQFLIGTNVARADMKVGDLVFFRIKGKRISHVGIYLGEGRFIHAPSSGKTVSVSALSEAYWAKRFAGAKRPSVLS